MVQLNLLPRLRSPSLSSTSSLPLQKEATKRIVDAIDVLTGKEERDEVNEKLSVLDSQTKELANRASQGIDTIAAKNDELKNATIDKLSDVEEKIVSTIDSKVSNTTSSMTRALSKIQEQLEHLENLNESCSEKTMLERQEAQRRNLASQRKLRIRRRNPTTQHIKLVDLSQKLLAENLRQLSESLPNKRGMVNFCFHSQPTAETATDLKQPNDEKEAHDIFDGSWDSMNAPSKGANRTLDIPNYLTSMIFNLKLLGQKYMALCVEDPKSNHDTLHNSASCVNLLLK